MEAAKICPICGRPAVADAPQGLCPECLMKSGFDTRGPGGAGDGKSAFVPPSIAQVARLFPQLEIIELLGQGGMGAVYKARQPGLDRFVALKILPPNIAKDPGFAERFNREARALARLSHPNIVAVYDFGQAVDIPYFLMEYVEGSTLRQIVRGGKLSPADTLQVVMQICEALQFAHSEGVVHRDIKPENILIDQKGRVKIADFGIAKVLDQPAQDISLTGAKDLVGTAHYMAPEQLENPQTVDHRADIFSLGVVFYELLTGELPLGKFQAPSQKVRVDVRLDEVVLHTLEREPERRYQQASEVKTDVETIAATPEGPVPPVLQAPVPPAVAPSPPRPISTGINLGVVVAVIGAICLVALLVVAALLLVRAHKAPAGPQTAHLVSSNAFWALLDDDQRLFVNHMDQLFPSYFNPRSIEDLSKEDRADLEQRMISTLRGPHNTEFYQAIGTVAALRSTNALPLLRGMAFEHTPKMLRSEISNRRRWMATRALGVIGDQSAVPDLIHLLYHNYRYVRWWAQISLVRLTGQNFGEDWKAWGNWWNAQHGQPPFSPTTVPWWKGYTESDKLTAHIADNDRKFIETMKAKAAGKQIPAEAEEGEGKQAQ